MVKKKSKLQLKLKARIPENFKETKYAVKEIKNETSCLSRLLPALFFGSIG